MRGGEAVDQPNTKPRLVLFGMDIYLLTFVVIGGGFVLLGVFWLFFTHWPLPRYCGGRYAHVCGWIERGSGVKSSPGPPAGVRRLSLSVQSPLVDRPRAFLPG